MTVQCSDKTNCAQYGTSFCTNSAYTAFAQENCPKHCNLCSSSGSGTTGTCADKINNCASYGQSVCSDATYAGWVTENCPAFCGKCSSMSSGTMTSGGSGGIMYPSQGGSGGVITGTGGGGGAVTGTSTGCVYKSQVYQQGQTWKDGCTYSCTCTDGASGQYTCTGLCVQWNLPSACTLNPPGPGKCCQTPNCPANVQIQYPPNYIEQ